ncbi:MAG TPA: PAS domain-containing sensor histidine kinase [Gammaproteobacteria bacterium]|nr:PAS domain-containing sensor histidine kinase [Gammaproteobacteria bacterium]
MGITEQTRLLYKSMPFSLAASMLNGMVLVYMLRNVVSESVLLIWLAFLAVTTVFRAYLYIGYRLKKYWPEADRRWHKCYLAGVIASSLIWGSSTILIFPDTSLAHQAFLAFVIAGMSAGAVSSLAHSRVAILIFLTCLLPLLAIRFVVENTELGYAMGFMVALYYFVLLSTAQNTYKDFRQKIELHIDAEAQKKALQESHEKYSSIFEFSPLGIIHYRKDGLIASSNKMFRELFALNKQELETINLLTFSDDCHFRNAVSHSLTGNIAQYEGSTKAISSIKDTPIRIFFRDIRDLEGEVTGGVAIVEDKTEDRRIDTLKSAFVSTVSHELRTPLTAISGSIGLLKNAGDKLTGEMLNSLLSNIERNSGRLLTLVNDILDMEKISSGKMDFHFEKCSILKLVQLSISDNQSYADKFEVRFRLGATSKVDNIEINVDQQRFLQVMANLLSNAAKFSGAGSEVTIDIFDLGHVVEVAVEDKGVGIAEEFQEKVFHKFTQQDSSDTRIVGGTGLGLSISKEIIERMGGEIDFRSTIGEGTVFYINLPKASREVVF